MSENKSIFGRYAVGKFLGEGTYAKVYHATKCSTGEEVAIKVFEKDEKLKLFVEREIRIMRSVRHPNIVRLHEVMASKTKIYFVMEFVRGGQLLTKVLKSRLREETARKYFQQLISAVAFCHKRGVYHRDIKAENILIDENGDLKVADFGLGVIADKMHQRRMFYTVCGTQTYMAPEVHHEGQGYNASKADIWSCGVLLFVLVAGFLPFQHSNPQVLKKNISKGNFRCPTNLSPDLVRLIYRLLDTNPQRRFTIAQIMQDKWFRKDFKFEHSSSSPSLIQTHYHFNGGMKKPRYLNAFDILSFSPVLNLSSLFENKGDQIRLLMHAPVWLILSKLEEIAIKMNFMMRTENYQVSIDGYFNDRTEPLSITVEIFQITHLIMVVEVSNKATNNKKYEEFCEKELKPHLGEYEYDSSMDKVADESSSIYISNSPVYQFSHFSTSPPFKEFRPPIRIPGSSVFKSSPLGISPPFPQSPILHPGSPFPKLSPFGNSPTFSNIPESSNRVPESAIFPLSPAGTSLAMTDQPDSPIFSPDPSVFQFTPLSTSQPIDIPMALQKRPRTNAFYFDGFEDKNKEK